MKITRDRYYKNVKFIQLETFWFRERNELSEKNESNN